MYFFKVSKLLWGLLLLATSEETGNTSKREDFCSFRENTGGVFRPATWRKMNAQEFHYFFSLIYKLLTLHFPGLLTVWDGFCRFGKNNNYTSFFNAVLTFQSAFVSIWASGHQGKVLLTSFCTWSNWSSETSKICWRGHIARKWPVAPKTCCLYLSSFQSAFARTLTTFGPPYLSSMAKLDCPWFRQCCMVQATVRGWNRGYLKIADQKETFCGYAFMHLIIPLLGQYLLSIPHASATF